MWDGSILKSNAKVALRGRYWTAFLVTLLVSILSGDYSQFSYGLKAWDRFTNWSITVPFLGQPFWAHPFLAFASPLWGILIVLPLAVGMKRYFVHSHFEPAGAGTLFSGFSWGYGNSVGALFVTNLFIVLWTFLLIIPGIVKDLEYSMVPFLLSDNPQLPGSRVRELSRRMTDGQKGDIFVFRLSFLGWFLLGLLCAGVGTLFVLPYYEASQAELYLFLRERALEQGIVSPVELGLVPPGPRL